MRGLVVAITGCGRGLVLVAIAGCGRFHFDPLADSSPADSRPADASDGSGRVLYAASQSQLFRVDPVSLVETPVMPLCMSIGAPQLADIAISSTQQIVAPALATTAFYRIDATGNCTLVGNLAVRMFGLEFMPPDALGSEVLIGAGDDGNLYRIDPQTAGIQLVGAVGALPGGDLTWTGSVALLTTQAGATNHLSRVDLTTGVGTDLGDTTYNSVTGLAWLDGALYGFANAGTIFELSPTTGAPIRMRQTAELWSGATLGD